MQVNSAHRRYAAIAVAVRPCLDTTNGRSSGTWSERSEQIQGGTMAGYDLRPLSVGEILDRTFTLYRNHFWLFVSITVFPAAIHLPMNLFIFKGLGFSIPFVTRPALPNPAAIAVLYLVVLPLFYIAYSVGLGATTSAVSEVYLGHATTMRSSYRRVFRRFWRLMGLIFVVGCILSAAMFAIFFAMAIVLAGVAAAGRMSGAASPVLVIALTFASMIAAIAVTIFFAMLFAVTIPVLLVENQHVGGALQRSIHLTKGKRWQIFLGVLLTLLLSYVAAIVFQGPFWLLAVFAAHQGALPLWLLFMMSLSAAIGSAVSSPLFMIVLVLFYYDARIRKEAFDLQHMMATMAPPNLSPAQGVSPA
jgi:hypothetical protein